MDPLVQKFSMFQHHSTAYIQLRDAVIYIIWVMDIDLGFFLDGSGHFAKTFYPIKQPVDKVLQLGKDQVRDIFNSALHF